MSWNQCKIWIANFWNSLWFSTLCSSCVSALFILLSTDNLSPHIQDLYARRMMINSAKISSALFLFVWYSRWKIQHMKHTTYILYDGSRKSKFNLLSHIEVVYFNSSSWDFFHSSFLFRMWIAWLCFHITVFAVLLVSQDCGFNKVSVCYEELGRAKLRNNGERIVVNL